MAVFTDREKPTLRHLTSRVQEEAQVQLLGITRISDQLAARITTPCSLDRIWLYINGWHIDVYMRAKMEPSPDIWIEREKQGVYGIRVIAERKRTLAELELEGWTYRLEESKGVSEAYYTPKTGGAEVEWRLVGDDGKGILTGVFTNFRLIELLYPGIINEEEYKKLRLELERYRERLLEPRLVLSMVRFDMHIELEKFRGLLTFLTSLETKEPNAFPVGSLEGLKVQVKADTVKPLKQSPGLAVCEGIRKVVLKRVDGSALKWTNGRLRVYASRYMLQALFDWGLVLRDDYNRLFSELCKVPKRLPQGTRLLDAIHVLLARTLAAVGLKLNSKEDALTALKGLQRYDIVSRWGPVSVAHVLRLASSHEWSLESVNEWLELYSEASARKRSILENLCKTLGSEPKLTEMHLSAPISPKTLESLLFSLQGLEPVHSTSDGRCVVPEAKGGPFKVRATFRALRDVRMGSSPDYSFYEVRDIRFLESVTIESHEVSLAWREGLLSGKVNGRAFDELRRLCKGTLQCKDTFQIPKSDAFVARVTLEAALARILTFLMTDLEVEGLSREQILNRLGLWEKEVIDFGNSVLPVKTLLDVLRSTDNWSVSSLKEILSSTRSGRIPDPQCLTGILLKRADFEVPLPPSRPARRIRTIIDIPEEIANIEEWLLSRHADRINRLADIFARRDGLKAKYEFLKKMMGCLSDTTGLDRLKNLITRNTTKTKLDELSHDKRATFALLYSVYGAPMNLLFERYFGSYDPGEADRMTNYLKATGFPRDHSQTTAEKTVRHPDD